MKEQEYMRVDAIAVIEIVFERIFRLYDELYFAGRKE